MGGSTKKPGRIPRPSQIQAEALLGVLPHPLLVIGEGMKIDYVNTAAEDFFQMSAAVLCRRLLNDVVAFGSPLIELVEQVQRNGTTVNDNSAIVRFKYASVANMTLSAVIEVASGKMPLITRFSMA